MPRLHEFEKLLLQIQYPGQTVIESAVTRLWISAHPDDYDQLEFNVRVGPPNLIPEGVDESTARLNNAVGRRRIDIVAWHGSLVDLVEVKPRLTLSAIGQLKGYRALWSVDRPEASVDRLIAAGTLAVEGVALAFQLEGIQVELFPTPVVPSDQI